MQLPIPYDSLVGVLARGLAKFLTAKGAAANFRSLQSLPPAQQEAYWLGQIVPHRDEGTLKPSHGSKDVYPAILYSFLTLYTPNDIGWPMPRAILERMVEKATKIGEGQVVRVAEHGMLMVSMTEISQDALPWDLVINVTTGAKARIRWFIDNHRCLLSAPIFFAPGPYEIWRSDYYNRRRLCGSAKMLWSGMTRSEREANLLGGLLVEYFTAQSKDDTLWGCLWGNEGDTSFEVLPEAIGSLTPSEFVSERQEIIERRDLDVSFRIVSLVECKLDPIMAVFMAMNNERVHVGPEWLLES